MNAFRLKARSGIRNRRVCTVNAKRIARAGACRRIGMLEPAVRALIHDGQFALDHNVDRLRSGCEEAKRYTRVAGQERRAECRWAARDHVRSVSKWRT